MVFEKVDIKLVIDSVTALVIALGVLYTAYKANKVHTTAKTIEASVNGTASKAQEVINDLRRQLTREKEISQEKTQVAAVLQASSGQHTAAQQQVPIEAVIVNEAPVPVVVEKEQRK